MVSFSSNLDDTGYWKDSLSRSENGMSRQDRDVSDSPFSNSNDRSSKNRISMFGHMDETRFILWVDAVGGYLVCPNREVTIGQAIAESRVDIPILGDLARHHLKLIRSPEGYLLEPFGYVEVNGIETRQKILLNHGDLIELTGGIQINFSKPHPLSASARLDFASAHRTQPWSDAVLLMAESCVFGPNMRNHVVCRAWSEDLVFFQKNGRLFCKSFKPMTVDGSVVEGKAELSPNSRIEGEDFSMTIEPLSS